jgi:hypothetical protein
VRVPSCVVRSLALTACVCLSNGQENDHDQACAESGILQLPGLRG